MRHLALLVTLTMSTAPVIAANDAENGQKLHDENCVACHQSMFEGDAHSIYTRENRHVTDYNKLQNQVQRCSLNLRLNWFDSEINAVSDYLNQQYYHFKTEPKQAESKKIETESKEKSKN